MRPDGHKVARGRVNVLATGANTADVSGPKVGREEIAGPVGKESKGGPFGGSRRKSIHTGREQRRLAICDATRAAGKAGAYETPSRAGSLEVRRALDLLLGETNEGRGLLAEAERHVRGCMLRAPGRPPSVACSCSGDDPERAPS